MSFVGFRQSAALPAAWRAYQPHVGDSYALTRVANAALRCAGWRAVPCAVADAALKVCGPAFVEAILACDPELVLLDVRWGRALAALLERDFPGAVFVSGDASLRRRFVGSVPHDSSLPVSIVLPTYNGSKYLRQSISSCLDQSHRAIEVIVVDDGSREDIAGIVAEFGDGRVRYIRHPSNRGLPAALNTGFAHATGELLTWTSDDNYYAPDAIERMAGFLARHPAIRFVYTSMHIVDDTYPAEAGLHAEAGLDTISAFPRVRQALPPSVLQHQNAIGGCFLYHRDVYTAVGDYNQDAALVEDYDYWVRVSKRFRMQRLFEPLYHYRHHADSLTSQHGVAAVAVRFDMVRQQNGIA